MVPPDKLYYLNALFDFELGGYPIASLASAAREMTPLFSFCGTERDRVLLDVEVHQDFWDYCDYLKLPHAVPLDKNETPESIHAEPWGWNKKSVALFDELGVAMHHPNCAVVRTINCREYCAALNKTYGLGVPGTEFCATMDTMYEVAHRLAGKFPLVAKPAYGGSGFGFLIINALAEIKGSLSEHCEKLFLQSGLTLEPWCNRIYDISSFCRIGTNGTIGEVRHYHCLANKAGAFYGVVFGAVDAYIKNYQEDLDRAVSIAARELYKTGYFGPVSFDSFVYHDAVSGREMLAAVIEINGRYVMSSIAHSLHNRIGDTVVSLFRFISKRKCRLPKSYEEWDSQIGDDGFSRSGNRGVISLSPLRNGHNDYWRQPARSAFFITAETLDEVMAMDKRLRISLGAQWV